MFSRLRIIIILFIFATKSMADTGGRKYCLSYRNPNTDGIVSAILSMSENPLFPYILSHLDQTSMLVKAIKIWVVEGGFGAFLIDMEIEGFPEKVTGEVGSIIE